MTHDESARPGGPDPSGPSPDPAGPGRGLTRRGVLAAGTVLGASATLAVAGCTTYRPDTGSGDGGAPPGSGSASSGAAAALGATSEIPVGGGKVFAARKLVVTQPTAGTFKAFSSVCTHQGCQVTDISGGSINCDCHGSRFSATDGSVTAGPARRPLAARQVSTDGGQITVT